jgi:hypothetical protein
MGEATSMWITDGRQMKRSPGVFTATEKPKA